MIVKSNERGPWSSSPSRGRGGWVERPSYIQGSKSRTPSRITHSQQPEGGGATFSHPQFIRSNPSACLAVARVKGLSCNPCAKLTPLCPRPHEPISHAGANLRQKSTADNFGQGQRVLVDPKVHGLLKVPLQLHEGSAPGIVRDAGATNGQEVSTVGVGIRGEGAF